VVPVPTLEQEFSDAIRDRLVAAGVEDRHRIVRSTEGSVPAPSLRGVEVTTMGRGASEDPAFFAAAFAAGDIAFRMARGVLD
jgi:hypothetical protein